MSCGRHVIQVPAPEVTKICVPTPIPPAVIKATERVGPAGRPGSAAHQVEAENKSGSTISAGQAVALHSSGIGWLAADQGASVTRAVALAVETKAAAVSLAVQVGDVLELSDWTAATGAATLPPRSRWYLGSGGMLTQTPSMAGGNITQCLGEALSPTKMAIRIGAPIKRS